MTTEYAFGVQLGLYYKLNETLSLGASYSSGQDYNPFQWSTTHANPLITSGSQAFSTRWDIEIDLDQPPSFSFGAGYRASEKLLIGGEVKWVGYADTTGIGGTGGIGPDGDLISIGWRDIWIGMIGAQYQASEKLQLRAGFNYSQSPIREEVALNSGGTPAVFEQHYTLGLGYTVNPNFRLELAGYYTPENGAVPGEARRPPRAEAELQ
jgi:long-chain fatty acid transport protein